MWSASERSTNDDLGTVDSPHVWSAVLKATGAGRFFGAAFLGFWLCGWLVGECFAVAGLVFVIAETVAPGISRSIGVTTETPQGPAALAIGGFLLVWLAGWTFGGLMALREVLRLLWGEDRLRLEAEHLVVEHRGGIRLGTTRILLTRLVDVRSGPGPSLMAESPGKNQVISKLGTADEIARVASELRPFIVSRRGDPRALERMERDELPQEWVEVTPAFDPGGSTDPSPARVVLEMRRSAARGLGITLACLGVLPLWGVVTGVAARVWGDPHGASVGALAGYVVFTMVLGGLAGACLTWRRTIRLRPRWLELRTDVLGWRRSRVYEPPYLAIEISTDTDGDVWSRLIVSDARHRSTLASGMTDTSGPRHFGRWLAHRLEVPLEGPRGASDRRHAGL